MVARMAGAQCRPVHYREHILKKRDLSSYSGNALREEILSALGSGAPLRLDDLLRRLGITRRAKRAVLDSLHELESSGAIVSLRGGAWALASRLKRLRGVLSVQRSGAAFVRPESNVGGKRMADIFIAPEDLGGAWDGDSVEISLFPAPKSAARGPKAGFHAEGRVLAVLERPRQELTVRVLRPPRPAHLPDTPALTLLCRPADPRLELELLVDVSGLPLPPVADELLRVAVGERLDTPDSPINAAHDSVYAPPTGFRRSAHTPRRKGVSSRRASSRPLLPLWSATALSSLGREDDARVQEDLTKLNHNIPTSFSDAVLAEAERAAAELPSSAPGLEDLRPFALVTIDGEDARDFDDAIFVTRNAHGWRLLVAIADVSHYVRPRGQLDREARERGNSCYFPCSVEPMLPEALSNGACSLRPGEDRRAMAADISFDHTGAPVSARFSNALIRSRARLTYTQVEKALKEEPDKTRGSAPCPGGGAEPPRSGERSSLSPVLAPELAAMLADAAELATLLIKKRHDAGGLDFDLPEAEFNVENGKVTGIGNSERLFSHRLIEAFMVAANEAVARFLTEKGAPFLYRVHPAPSSEKLEELARGLNATGLDLPLPPPAKVTRDANWLPALLEAVHKRDDLRPEQVFLVNRISLRSMMQARYAPEEEGHFGLASHCYCHFTSPIRRYADLVTHRALKYALGLDAGGAIPAGQKLLAVAERCNVRERAAQDAEREIIRRFGCLLLRDRIGETFTGVISGVTRFGLFVEPAGMPLEGMVRVETLGQDYFEYDAERQELRGAVSNLAYRLGQSVKVRLAEVNPGRLEITLELLDVEKLPARTGRGRERGKPHSPRSRKNTVRTHGAEQRPAKAGRRRTEKNDAGQRPRKQSEKKRYKDAL